jgi:hypothetical protein
MTRLSRAIVIGLVGIGLSIPAAQYWRGETLTRLKQCYREIPTAGSKYFVSPCARMKVGLFSLAGISRGELESRFGGGDFCFDQGARKSPEKQCLRRGWAFFYLPPNSLGGGPYLTCSITDGNTCFLFVWMLTA